ncbi:hypothetical protein BGX31_007928 [Mortierella sp. GBA43]|nr:hypothetical protein BGX31_007928 [Mortierella sp. GBA43]
MSANAPLSDADKMEASLLENDYDELVDDDWLDMGDPSQLARTSSQSPPVLVQTPTNDDHQVPSLAQPDISQSTPVHSTAATLSMSTTPLAVPASEVSKATPHSLKVSTGDESPGKQAQVNIPGSTSPASSTSDSEYSLLQPSAEPSRKNSLSSLTGFHGFTPSVMSTSSSPISRTQDQDQDRDRDPDEQPPAGTLTPSLSDFVQVESHREEESPGVESVSEQLSHIEVPSCASSEGKGQSDDLGIEVSPHSGDSDIPNPPVQDEHGESKSTLDVNVTSDSTDAIVTTTAIPSTASSSTDPVKRAKYRTTVEDATSSDEEQRYSSQASGLRWRSSAKQEDTRNIHRSSPHTSASTPTMPGAFNVGLDAEILGFDSSTATTAADPPMDERQCRICLGGVDDEDTLGRLISPCLCKGSMKYVHVGCEDYDDAELSQLQEKKYVFKTPDSLRAVFRIDQTHMVFGSFFVSIVGFLQLLLSTIWMGGGGGVFRIGGFGLGGRRRGVRGDRQREASFGGIILAMMLVFGLFKSIYTSYKLVRRVSRHVLAKAEMMVLEVQ